MGVINLRNCTVAYK